MFNLYYFHLLNIKHSNGHQHPNCMLSGRATKTYDNNKILANKLNKNFLYLILPYIHFLSIVPNKILAFSWQLA